jgi:hypothetical protein
MLISLSIRLRANTQLSFLLGLLATDRTLYAARESRWHKKLAHMVSLNLPKHNDIEQRKSRD